MAARATLPLPRPPLASGRPQLKTPPSPSRRAIAVSASAAAPSPVTASLRLGDVIEAQQFDREALNEIFEVGREMEAVERGSHGARSRVLEGYLMATLFYEPSTRTRLSFEAAMRRLGGEVLTTENAREFSSAAKGETLEGSSTPSFLSMSSSGSSSGGSKEGQQPGPPVVLNINSGVFAGGPPVPVGAQKMLKFVDTSQVTMGPHDSPGYWLVTGARLDVDKGKISLHVKFSLRALAS